MENFEDAQHIRLIASGYSPVNCTEASIPVDIKTDTTVFQHVVSVDSDSSIRLVTELVLPQNECSLAIVTHSCSKVCRWGLSVAWCDNLCLPTGMTVSGALNEYRESGQVWQRPESDNGRHWRVPPGRYKLQLFPSSSWVYECEYRQAGEQTFQPMPECGAQDAEVICLRSASNEVDMTVLCPRDLHFRCRLCPSTHPECCESSPWSETFEVKPAQCPCPSVGSIDWNEQTCCSDVRLSANVDQMPANPQCYRVDWYVWDANTPPPILPTASAALSEQFSIPSCSSFSPPMYLNSRASVKVTCPNDACTGGDTAPLPFRITLCNTGRCNLASDCERGEHCCVNECQASPCSPLTCSTSRECPQTVPHCCNGNCQAAVCEDPGHPVCRFHADCLSWKPNCCRNQCQVDLCDTGGGDVPPGAGDQDSCWSVRDWLQLRPILCGLLLVVVLLGTAAILAGSFLCWVTNDGLIWSGLVLWEAVERYKDLDCIKCMPCVGYLLLIGAILGIIVTIILSLYPPPPRFPPCIWTGIGVAALLASRIQSELSECSGAETRAFHSSSVSSPQRQLITFGVLGLATARLFVWSRRRPRRAAHIHPHRA